MTKITLSEHHCKRCGHTWFPRPKHTVKICPKCKTARWNEPKRVAVAS